MKQEIRWRISSGSGERGKQKFRGPELMKAGLRWVGLALLAAGLSACLSKPALVKQTFAFERAVPNVAQVAGGGKGVLQIRTIRVAAPYASQSFVYRTGPSSYERDPYAEFLVPPEQSLLAPLQDYFQSSGLFSNVVARGSAANADTFVEIYVPQLYGDFRNKTAPVAVLGMKFTFFGAKEGVPGKVLLEKEYEQRVPFHKRTAAALMAAWNTALEKTLGAVAGDLKAARNGGHPAAAANSNPG